MAGHVTGLFQLKTLHFLVERRAVDAQNLGRCVAVPVVAFKHFEDDLPFRTFQGLFERMAADRASGDRRGDGQVGGQVVHVHAAAFAQQGRSRR